MTQYARVHNFLLSADGYGAGVRFRVREGGADAGLRPEELNSANDG